MSDKIDMTIDAFNGLQMMRFGKLRALAVLSPKRSSALPQVPKIHEASIGGMTFNSGAGVPASAGTSPEIFRRLNAEPVRMMAVGDVRQPLERMDYESVCIRPEQCSVTLTEGKARWTKLVKVGNFSFTT